MSVHAPWVTEWPRRRSHFEIWNNERSIVQQACHHTKTNPFLDYSLFIPRIRLICLLLSTVKSLWLFSGASDPNQGQDQNDLCLYSQNSQTFDHLRTDRHVRWCLRDLFFFSLRKRADWSEQSVGVASELIRRYGDSLSSDKIRGIWAPQVKKNGTFCRRPQPTASCIHSFIIYVWILINIDMCCTQMKCTNVHTGRLFWYNWLTVWTVRDGPHPLLEPTQRWEPMMGTLGYSGEVHFSDTLEMFQRKLKNVWYDHVNMTPASGHCNFLEFLNLRWPS